MGVDRWHYCFHQKNRALWLLDSRQLFFWLLRHFIEEHLAAAGLWQNYIHFWIWLQRISLEHSEIYRNPSVTTASVRFGDRKTFFFFDEGFIVPTVPLSYTLVINQLLICTSQHERFVHSNRFQPVLVFWVFVPFCHVTYLHEFNTYDQRQSNI